MDILRPDLIPVEPVETDQMRAIQTTVRELAIFADETPDRIPPAADSVTVGIDQAFSDERVISAAVAVRNGEILERAVGVRPVTMPYVPGFLAFREAPAIAAAIKSLTVEPDLLLVDGNGRLHPRFAGLATHVGVAVDCPTVGVAKSLLCGTLRDGPDPPYQEGTRIPIVTDASFEVGVPAGTVLGYAVQTRQWDRSGRTINPVYASPGHRVGPDTAAAATIAACAGYKLPEPIRLADQLAGERAAET